jgi:SOS response regulatory protein OraA/RecX
VQSDSTGKKIEEIKFSKKGVEIHFEDKSSYLVDTSTLTEYYLYKDKIIDQKTYKLIQKASEFLPFKKYLDQLLSKGRYSELQIRMKLKAKKALDSIINELVFYAKKNLLIDDEAFKNDLVEYYLTKNVGIRYIKQQLLNKGISKPLIESVFISSELQEASAVFQLGKLENKIKTKPYLAKKEIVYRTLSAKGFEENVISKTLSLIEIEDDQTVKEALIKHYLIAQNKYQKKYKAWELNHRIFQYLKAKGYNSSDIKKMIGAQSHDLD